MAIMGTSRGLEFLYSLVLLLTLVTYIQSAKLEPIATCNYLTFIYINYMYNDKKITLFSNLLVKPQECKFILLLRLSITLLNLG